MNKPDYKKRLLRLADYLDKIQETKPDTFNFATWISNNWNGEQHISCGTTACALGHGATMPAFRKLGLRIVKNTNEITAFATICLKEDAEQVSSGTYPGNPFFATVKATARIFDLDRNETEYLFTPNHGGNRINNDASAKEVADHIRDFVINKYGP